MPHKETVQVTKRSRAVGQSERDHRFLIDLMLRQVGFEMISDIGFWPLSRSLYIKTPRYQVANSRFDPHNSGFPRPNYETESEHGRQSQDYGDYLR